MDIPSIKALWRGQEMIEVYKPYGMTPKKSQKKSKKSQVHRKQHFQDD